MERSAERISVRLRRHPWLVDGTLAVILLAGSANAFGNAAVLPASLVLAGAVAVRSRFPVGAYATALAVGVAQVAVGIGSTYTDSPSQPHVRPRPLPRQHHQHQPSRRSLASRQGEPGRWSIDPVITGPVDHRTGYHPALSVKIASHGSPVMLKSVTLIDRYVGSR